MNKLQMALKQIILTTMLAFFVVEAFTISLSKRAIAGPVLPPDEIKTGEPTTTTIMTPTSSTERAVLKKEYCKDRMPCGWGAYNKTTRYIDYFMKNNCVCTPEQTCFKDDDDISLTAFVYRCISTALVDSNS